MASYTAAYTYLVQFNFSSTFEIIADLGPTGTTDNLPGSSYTEDVEIEISDNFIGNSTVIYTGANGADGFVAQGTTVQSWYYYFTNTPTAGPITIAGVPFPVCFLTGTMIATADGERAVEALAAGDVVLTADGSTREILWIGRQTVVAAFADPVRSYPIRIAAGALAENVPARDLFVSPDHALLVDGLLVQAGALINGSTVTRVELPESRFTYYHIELEDHALVLADGAPAETFVDNVTRRRFDNYAEYEALFGRRQAHIRELALPRVKSARQVPRAVRERLAVRAKALGFVAAAAA